MKFVIIRAYDNYVYAHIVLGMLQESGINAHLKDEMTVTIDPLLSPALGGIKIIVPEDEVPRADELIQEIEKQQREDVPSDEE